MVVYQVIVSYCFEYTPFCSEYGEDSEYDENVIIDELFSNLEELKTFIRGRKIDNGNIYGEDSYHKDETIIPKNLPIGDVLDTERYNVNIPGCSVPYYRVDIKRRTVR